MSIATVSALMEALDSSRLLPADQAAVLTRLRSRFTEPRALAKELLERDWLTPYQVNQLFAGRGSELVLGQYVILERLGEGGMGQVFKARQFRMSRVVALKVIRKDRLANQDAVKRFHREIQAAAQLSHPNVVVAYDADQVNGTHFFAMEYVEGTDLARLIRESGPLPAAFACDYVRQAALGLQHAHEKGMVHRDIKPSNLLVAWAASRKTKTGSTQPPTQVTGRPVIKILDMGLARLNSDDENSTSELTREGAVMGTLDYLAPEQAQNSRLADIRSDLYSLGCTFYFLLTAQVPFPGGTATEKLLKHRLDDATPVDRIRPEVPPGVVAVVRKLMAKKPEDRFQTPGELAEVMAVPLASIGTGIVGSNRNGSIVAAEHRSSTLVTPVAPLAILVTGNVGTPVAAAIPLNNNGTLAGGAFPNLAKKPWRWLGWKGGLAAGVLGLGLLVALVLFLRSGPDKGARAPDPLPSAEKTTEADLKHLKDRLEDYTDTEAVRTYLLAVQRVKRGEPTAIQAASLLELLPAPMDRLNPKNVSDTDRAVAGPIDGLLAVYGDPRLRQWATSNGARLRGMDVSPDGKLVVTGGDDGIVRLWNASNGQPQMTLSNGGMIFWTSFGPDGKRVFAGGGFGAVKAWELPTGSSQPAPPGSALGFSPDRRLVAMKPQEKPNQIKVYQLARGQEVSTFSEHTKEVHCITFTADGQLAASSGMDQTIYIWETATGRLRHTFRGHQDAVHRMQFSADGRWLAAYEARTETLKLWQVNPERDRGTFEKQRQVWAMSPDGRTLIVRGPDPFQMKLYDTMSGTERATLRHRDAPISALAFSPDGRLLASAAFGSESLKLWNIPAGTEHGLFKGQAGNVGTMKFTTDSKTLVTANSEGVVKLWDIESGEERRATSNSSDWYTSAAFSPDGKTLALASRGMVRLIDTATAKERAAIPGHNGDVNALAFSPDGLTLATAGADGNARLWDVASGQVQATLRHGGGYSIGFVGFTPDGATVVTGEGWSVRFWHTSNGVSRGEWKPPKDTTFSSYPAIAPDGKTVAVCLDGSGINFWDVDVGKERPPPVTFFKERTIGIAYSADHKFLVGRSIGGQFKVWDLAGKKERASLPPCFLWEVAPDSQTIATFGEERQLRTWDAATGQLRTTLEGHSANVSCLVYSADGQKLATAGNDGRVILWEPFARKRKIGEAQLPGPALRLALSPDGRHVASINGNGTVYLLRLAPPPAKSGS